MKSPGSGLSRWERLETKTLVKTRVFDLDSIRYRHPGRQTERDFIVARPPDWVNVLALTPDRQLVLIRQFRFGADDFSLEIPGGVMNAGEDPVAAGLRELREETGYAGQGARLLGSVHPNPAIQSNRCHFVLVGEARPGAPVEWDQDEEIAVELRSPDEVFAMARSGGITHGLVLNALLFFEPIWRAMAEGRGI